MKPTGIELITQERYEQIEKHGYTVQEDIYRYDEEVTGKYPEPSDLVEAAIASIYGDKSKFPYWEESKYIDNICQKEYIARLAVAGALIAAEIDRLHAVNEQ